LSRRHLLSTLVALSAEGCRCDDSPGEQNPLTPMVDRNQPAYLRRVDVHLHIDVEGATRARELMREEGIAIGVNLSGGAPGGMLEAQLRAAASFEGRLLVFTSPPWEETQRPGFGARFEHALRQAARLGARGLKIHKALGLAVRHPDGKLLRVDDPELDPLFRTAGELNLPVMIHTGDPLAFWRPPNSSNERLAELEAHPSWSLFGADIPSFEDLYAQYEARIQRHPNTTFVGVHFGNCAEQPDRVASSLRKYPNLYIDTAARIPELGRHPPATVRAFFEEFQDRILFGSDLGIGPPGKSLFLGSRGKKKSTDAERRLFFDATRTYFETATSDLLHPTPIQGDWRINGIELPLPILEKLYSANATRLLKLA
jgi:predicted TIM-barrel fold metal-dependent hydrolase